MKKICIALLIIPTLLLGQPDTTKPLYKSLKIFIGIAPDVGFFILQLTPYSTTPPTSTIAYSNPPPIGAFGFGGRIYARVDNHVLEFFAGSTLKTLNINLVQPILNTNQYFPEYISYPSLGLSYRYTFFDNTHWQMNVGIMFQYSISSWVLGKGNIINSIETKQDASNYTTEYNIIADFTLAKADTHIFSFGPVLGIKYKLGYGFCFSMDVRSQWTPYYIIGYNIDYKLNITRYQGSSQARINQTIQTYTEHIEVKQFPIDIGLHLGISWDFVIQ